MKKLYEFLYSKGIFVRTTKIFMALAVFGFTWSSAHAQTSYCTPVYTSTSDYTSSITTVGAVTNISYSASSQPTGGYADETAQVFESYETQTFDINTTYVGGSNTMYIWVDWNNDLIFDASELVSSYSTNTSQTISFTVPAGTAMGDYRMRIRSRFSTTAIDACESTSFGSAVDFTILVGPPPSCLSPTNLASNNITSSSVDIQWTANNSETDWNVSWGAPGYTPGDVDEVGSATGVTTNPYQITGLNGTTSYDIYVQADCGGGDESFWAGPLTVTTLCDVFAAPFFEDFNAGALPNCWDNLSSDPSTSANNFWKFTGTPGYGASSNGKTAGTYAWVDGSSPFSDSIMLITPLIDISALTVPALSFEWFGNNTDNPGDHNPFVVSVHDGTQWHFIDSLDGDSPEWRERLYDLSPYAGNIIQVRFMVNNALLGSSLAYYQDILLDDVRIDEMPTCPKPLDLQVDAATFSSVDISWTPGDSETDWNVSWGAPGYTPGDGDEVGNASVTSPSYQITGLTENTYYDIYVQADCGSGDESMWVGPLTIYTGYCVPTSTGNTTRYIDGVVTQGALMNINNTGTGLSPDAYGDYTGTDTLRVYPGQEISVEFTHPSTTYHYKIWVDWDSDLDFDGPNDLIYATTSYQSSPHLVDITIPALTPEGVYRMRVRNSSTTLGGPCGNNASSETEDYILHIVSPPSCLPVSDIATTSATFQTSTITWTANNSETSWNISWGNPGYTPGDGDELGTDVSTSTTYQITGLTEDTHYDVYVQADCGGDESNWVGPLSVYTGYCVPTSTGNTTRYIDGVVTQGALMNINNTGTGLSPDAYGDYTGTDTLRVYPGQEISVEFTHPSTTYHYKIWVDWDSDLDFDGPNDLIYATTSYQSSPHLVDITIPALTPEGVYRMRVRNSSTTLGGPCGNNASSETEDYILHIVSPPSCLPVSDIATTSATFQTSTITWTANNSETSWNISWGNPGYTPGDGDELGTDVSTSTTYQITGLTGDTHYDVYVQADCGGGDESMWAGPYTIFTGYCEVSTTSTADYLSSVVSEDALTDISYSATTQPAGSDRKSTRLNSSHVRISYAVFCLKKKKKKK